MLGISGSSGCNEIPVNECKLTMLEVAAEVINTMSVLRHFMSNSLWSRWTDGSDEVRCGDEQVERGLAW